MHEDKETRVLFSLNFRTVNIRFNVLLTMNFGTAQKFTGGNTVPGQPHGEYLFQKMEQERAKIPNILKDEYLPVFIVRSLREKLRSPREDMDEEIDNLAMIRTDWNPFGMGQEEEDPNMWIDDPILDDNNLAFEKQFLLTQENLNFVGRYLKFAKNAMECLGVSKSKFGRHFTEEFEYPCLELLYLMDKMYNILPLSSYMLWLKDSSQITYFKKQFLAFAFSATAFSDGNRERSNRILERFLQSIILSYFCNPCSTPDLKKLKDYSGEILNLITTKLTIIGGTSSHAHNPSSVNHAIVLTMLKDADIPNTVRVRYFTEHINMILRSGKRPFQSAIETIQFQERYADPVKLVHLDMFAQTVSQMISVFSTNDVSNIISSTLQNTDFNWEMLLYFISVWIQEKQHHATSVMKELCKTQIRTGFLNNDENSVMSGFILARHCSLIASEEFSRYEKWFTNLFESEIYSPAKEPETFRLFTEILTKWVPVEPSCFLHVHITFRPFFPKGCRDMWSDYVTLAKIRISEYKEVEEAMEYEPNPNDPIQHEVGIAIKAFESRGKIPQSIVKMWIFSKQHYLNNFLPLLLKKPTNVVLTDSRLRLIELLKQEGKIPEHMYLSYRAAFRTP